MDPDIVNAKLESLARCIRRIEDRCPDSLQGLSENIDAQDIVVLNLERAVQIAVDIGSHILLDFPVPSPDSMAGVFLALGKAQVIDDALATRLAKAAGFRNIAVHEYASIDWSIVYTIVTTRLDDFRDYARTIARLLEK
jgi:uncharacterized protein YutE (UPF0331/DUF86 family)